MIRCARRPRWSRARPRLRRTTAHRAGCRSSCRSVPASCWMYPTRSPIVVNRDQSSSGMTRPNRSSAATTTRPASASRCRGRPRAGPREALPARPRRRHEDLREIGEHLVLRMELPARVIVGPRLRATGPRRGRRRRAAPAARRTRGSSRSRPGPGTPFRCAARPAARPAGAAGNWSPANCAGSSGCGPGVAG